MYPSHVITVTINRPFQAVYDFISQPKNFALWASGIGKISQDNGQWVAETEHGLMSLLFTEENTFGIADHYVIPPTGDAIYVPMRVINNHGAADVQLTLFQTPDMSAEKCKADRQWVEKDLAALKKHLEAHTL